MKHFPRTIPLTALSLATVALITACGGGGSSTAAGPVTLAGAVIDGYIVGATVCLDLNGNGACDSGEPTTTSGANGAYSLTAPAGTDLTNLHVLANVPTTAIDGGVPIANAYRMLTPATMDNVISPLTTVVSTEMKVNSLSVANARIAARTDLALPAYDFLKDHIATPDVAAQNVAKVMAAVLANTVGATPPSNTTLNAALSTIKTNAPNVTPSTVAGLITSLGPQGTPTPTPTPTPSSCATSTLNCIGFQESTIGALGFEGLISAAVANDPAVGASNPVMKFVKGPSGQPWAGATIYTAGTVNPTPGAHSVLSVNRFGLEASKTVTMRVYSGAAPGTVITLKLENDVHPGVNIAAQTVTTVQNAWETLTFNFNSLTTGVYSASDNYNAAVVFPAFSINGPLTPLSADTAFYFDELKYAVYSANPTPTPTPTPSGTPIVSSGFSSATATANGGTWGVYSGGANNPAAGSGGDVAATPTFQYLYLQDTLANLGGYTYQGIFLKAPSGSTVSAASKTSLGYTMAINAEWYSAGAKFVVLIASNVAGVSNSTCNPVVAAVVQATASGAKAYSTPLSSFTKIAQDCGVASVTISQILAGAIRQVDFQADGGGAAITASGLTSNTNLSVPNAGTSVYSTTINVVGGVQFQ